jgi:hypothetical protein
VNKNEAVAEIDTHWFQEHRRLIPRNVFSARRPAMLFFCRQVSYTKEAWAKLIENPQDRLDAVRAPILAGADLSSVALR